jgi:formylmethanofuran dehydrogenase subunit E
MLTLKQKALPTFGGREMNPEHWEKAKAFHGHECPGLAIGVKVCEAAAEKMGVSPAFDEELVCITENDACGVDAVQALLGCTLGKGNLIYKGTGKQAFTFIKRGGEAMRFYLKARNNGMERSEYQEYLLNAPVDEVFDCKKVDIPPPERARIFSSVLCEECGEAAPEHKIRLKEGKRVCLDCFENYDRGWHS